MSNGWKKKTRESITKNGWVIYMAELPEPTYFLSYKGEQRGKFYDPEEAKAHADASDKNARRVG